MDLAKLFDSFYNRFILRDVFGKIVPGVILILGVSTILKAGIEIRSQIQNYLNLNSNFLWMLFLFFLALGIGWLAGFALERLGEISGVLIDPPGNIREREWLDLIIRFNRNTQAREWERNLCERLAVIKEACGNASIAIGIVAFGGMWKIDGWLFPILSIPLLLFSQIILASNDPNWTIRLERTFGFVVIVMTLVFLIFPSVYSRIPFMCLGAAAFLWLVHLKIARRQLIYIQRVLELPPW